jgi:hypothetical protein
MKTRFDKYLANVLMEAFDENALVEKVKKAKQTNPKLTDDEARKMIESDVYGQFKDADDAEKVMSRIIEKA